MKYLLGLDNGGTVIKAAVFDENGRQIAVASERVEIKTSAVGFVERDMEQLWQANAKAIKNATLKADIDMKKIVGIGISGHGKGLYLLDKNGQPLGDGIVSTDNRAIDYQVEFSRSDVGKFIREINFQDILACQPVCLLRWIKDNQPQRYEQIGAVLSVKDYIRYRLTGKIYAERTDISGTNLLNLSTGEYDREILEKFQIEEIFSALPPVMDSAADCGKLTKSAAELVGLSEDVIVAGGLFDIDACALALGIVDSKDICVIAGTWSINERIANHPAKVGVSMNSYYCIPDFYLMEECSPTSAGNLDWVLEHFFGEEIIQCGGINSKLYENLNLAVKSVETEENTLIFLPFIFASNEGVGFKGTFLNLTASTTKADIAAAVYEGIVFSHKSHIDKLLKASPFDGEIRLAGGAANSEVWCQMFADILGITIKTVSGREQGCFGAATVAGIACGVFRDYKHAVERVVEFDKVFKPNAQKMEIYEKKYKQYRKAIVCLSAFYEKGE